MLRRFEVLDGVVRVGKDRGRSWRYRQISSTGITSALCSRGRRRKKKEREKKNEEKIKKKGKKKKRDTCSSIEKENFRWIFFIYITTDHLASILTSPYYLLRFWYIIITDALRYTHAFSVERMKLSSKVIPSSRIVIYYRKIYILTYLLQFDANV